MPDIGSPFEWQAEAFAHYHENAPCEAHESFVRDFWSDAPYLVQIGFRGFGKSTLVEEAVAVGAYRHWYRSCLFIGPSEQRAAEHLISVTQSLKMNDELPRLFGGEVLPKGGADTQTYLELVGGRSIIAMGRGQNIRGLKKGNARPDLIIVDDFEDEDNVLTPEGRRGMLLWFLRALRRACHPRARFRVLCTIMHPECVPLQLVNTAGWQCRRYPAIYKNQDGAEASLWPHRFPLPLLQRDRDEARALGDAVGWELEMMCDETAAAEAGDFKPDHIKIVPRERAPWQPVYAMYDPARTVGRNSSMTGFAVWSWIGRKLVVWRAGAERWLPEQIVADMFDMAEIFDPVWIGFEEDGLNEWGKALVRDEERRRRVTLAYRGVKAPRDKHQFILSLRKYFEVGEVEWVSDFPELSKQLLGFPRPPIDAPNALAYALLLRPGDRIYEKLRDDHIVGGVEVAPYQPLYLAANAQGGWVAAALLQIFAGQIRILADWCLDGLPEDRVAQIQAEAQLVATTHRIGRKQAPSGYDALDIKSFNPLDPPVVTTRRAPTWLVPEWHYDRWMNIGLVQAIKHIPAMPQQGGSEQAGRKMLSDALARMEYGEAAVQISEAARWTLRALSGGYCRGRNGVDPEPGPYAVLSAGIEAALGVAAIAQAEGDEPVEQNWSWNRAGQRYKSVIPRHQRTH